MPLRSFAGKKSRIPMLGRMSRRISFGRSLLCCAWLTMAGTGISAVVAQEPMVDLNFNDGFVLDDMPIDDTPIEDMPIDDTGTTPDGEVVNEFGGEATITDGVVEPVPDGVNDDGSVIEPYYRNNSPSDGDPPVPVEGGPIPDDLLEILWCFGPFDPPIYFELSSLAMSAQTPNQIAVATQMDALSGFTTPAIQSVIDDVGLLTPTEQRAAFDSLSGESYGTLSSIGLQIGERSLRTVSNRLVNNLGFLSGGGGVLVGKRQPAPTPMGGEQLLVLGQSPTFGPTGWMQGYGSNGSWSSNGNAAGADYRLGGFAYGADLAGDDTGVFGISGGHSYTSLGTDRGDSGNVASHQVGIYLLKNFDSFYGLSVFNYGHNSNKLTRLVTIGLNQQLVKSSLNSNQFGTYSEVGVNLDTEAVRFQPFLGLQYLSLSNGSAFEGPGGGVGLNVNGNSTDTLQTHLGARAILQTLRSDSGVEFRPYISARWMADLLNTDRATTAGFAGAPAGASWTVTGNHSGRHTGQIGPGFTALVADGVSLFANYDFLFGEHYYSHTGSGGVLFEF